MIMLRLDLNKSLLTISSSCERAYMYIASMENYQIIISIDHISRNTEYSTGPSLPILHWLIYQ